MASFPTLKTGAVQQYPASRAIRFSNHVMTFLDGTEQRYRSAGSSLRSWLIALDQLDEQEMSAMEQFFAGQQGAYQSFSFTDPWDGSVHPACTLAGDTLTDLFAGPMRSKTVIRIVEYKS